MYCGECGKDVGTSKYCRWCGAEQEPVADSEDERASEPIKAHPSQEPRDTEPGMLSDAGGEELTEANLEQEPPSFPPPEPPSFPDEDTEREEVPPVLQAWKTSVGFSLLGAFVGLPAFMVATILASMALSFGIASLADYYSGMGSELTNAVASALIMPIELIVAYVVQIIYAAKIYPSYFTEKPILTSNRIISFLNLMFGWIVFGALWNASLTRRSKGSSHIVLVVLTALSLLPMVYGVANTLSQAASYSSAYSGAASTDGATKLASAGNIAFRYPEEWELITDMDLEGLEDHQILGQNPQTFISAGPSGDASIVFSVFYIPDCEYTLEDIEKLQTTMTPYSAEGVSINGHEAVMLSFVEEGYTNLIVVPDMNGKITSVFSATYPSNDDDCIAVIDSLNVA